MSDFTDGEAALLEQFKRHLNSGHGSKCMGNKQISSTWIVGQYPVLQKATESLIAKGLIEMNGHLLCLTEAGLKAVGYRGTGLLSNPPHSESQ